MASLKEVKNRINSVKSTRQITSAMKMVASAKLHKAQNRIGNMLPYQQMLNRILTNFLGTDMAIESAFTEVRPVTRVAIVPFSSNSSLCGAFNSNVARLLEKTVSEYSSIGRENIVLYPVGKKIEESVKKLGFSFEKSYQAMADKPSYAESCLLAQKLMQDFLEQRIDAVHAAHQIHEAATDPLAHILLFMLHIQRYNGLSCLQKIEQEQFEQIALALAGVTQDQDAGGSFVVVPLIEIHQNVGAVLVLANIKAVGICLSAVVERVQVSHRACREDSFKLLTEVVPAGRHDRNKALPLAEKQPIHIELAPHQLRQHICL